MPVSPWSRRAKSMRQLIAGGNDLSVELALFVPARAPRSVTFPKDLLKRLVELDLTVVVRGYPVSDDDEA